MSELAWVYYSESFGFLVLRLLVKLLAVSIPMVQNTVGSIHYRLGAKNIRLFVEIDARVAQKARPHFCLHVPNNAIGGKFVVRWVFHGRPETAQSYGDPKGGHPLSGSPRPQTLCIPILHNLSKGPISPLCGTPHMALIVCGHSLVKPMQL